MVGVSVLGISGSVGTSTLKVLRQYKEFFQLISFSVHSNLTLAEAIVKEFSPETLCITDPKLKGIWGQKKLESRVVYGEEGLDEVVSMGKVDIVLTAIVGSIGARPTATAIRAKKKIALANKETLITFGPWIKKLVKEYGVSLVPVDSEHNALFQLLENQRKENIRNIILTASGGSFRDLPIEELPFVSVESALRHPVWKMGPKITVDSAGLVNKALEVIEAHFLFDFPYEQIEVVVHPESLTHGMVETKDGAVLQYTSAPDMIFPIAHSLFHPEPTPSLLIERKPHSWKSLHFWEPDLKRYPALGLAYQAGKVGGAMPAIFNASNEVAVQLFLENKIRFTQIPEIIEDSLQSISNSFPEDWQGFFEKDRETRSFVSQKYSKEVAV